MAATGQDAAIVSRPDRGPGIHAPPPRSSPDSNDGEPGLDRERQRRASARAKQQRKPGCAGALQGTLVHPRARPQYAAHAHPVSAAHARYERVGERKVRGILGVERPVGRPEVPRGVAQPSLLGVPTSHEHMLYVADHVLELVRERDRSQLIDLGSALRATQRASRVSPDRIETYYTYDLC